MLLDWAEATHPALFPRADLTFTRASPGYAYCYREYAVTGNALGVAGQDVYLQVPQVAFVAVAQPVADVQFVEVNGCWRPLPVAGYVDPQLPSLVPDAPPYTVGYHPDVDGVAETARLQTKYGFTARGTGAAGFAADLPAQILAQMRCEPGLQSITHNQH